MVVVPAAQVYMEIIYIISDCVADFRAQPLLHPCPTRCAPLASGAASDGTARQDREGTEFPALVCSKSCEQEFLAFKRMAVRCRDACGQRGPADLLQEMVGGDNQLQMLIPGDLTIMFRTLAVRCNNVKCLCVRLFCQNQL